MPSPGEPVVPLSVALSEAQPHNPNWLASQAVPWPAAVPDDALQRLTTWADQHNETAALIYGVYRREAPAARWQAYFRLRRIVGWGTSPETAAAALLAALADTPETPNA